MHGLVNLSLSLPGKRPQSRHAASPPQLLLLCPCSRREHGQCTPLRQREFPSDLLLLSCFSALAAYNSMQCFCYVCDIKATACTMWGTGEASLRPSSSNSNLVLLLPLPQETVLETIAMLASPSRGTVSATSSRQEGWRK